MQSITEISLALPVIPSSCRDVFQKIVITAIVEELVNMFPCTALQIVLLISENRLNNSHCIFLPPQSQSGAIPSRHGLALRMILQCADSMDTSSVSFINNRLWFAEMLPMAKCEFLLPFWFQLYINSILLA